MQETRPQAEVFGEARSLIAEELSAETLSLSFDQMLKRLREAIEEVGRARPSGKNTGRYFANNYLKMSGESYATVRGWLSGTAAMSKQDIINVLRVLDEHFSGKATIVSPPNREHSGISRKVIDHVISLLNSLIGLVLEAGVKPGDVFDSDRMMVRDALEHICRTFGIKVVFPESDVARKIPVTGEDLSDMGVGGFGTTRGDRR